jgi:hypothetical protein
MADNDPLARLIRGLDYEYSGDGHCLLCEGPAPCVTILCDLGAARVALQSRREQSPPPPRDDGELGRIAWLYDEPEEGAPTPWKDLDPDERYRYTEMARAVAHEVRRERDAVQAELLEAARELTATNSPARYVQAFDRLRLAVEAAEREREEG